jgi:hypothetical protein
MQDLLWEQRRAQTIGLVAIGLLIAMVAITAATGASQEAFEMVGPHYADRLAAHTVALRWIVGLDTGFLLAYTIFFRLFARAIGVADHPLVRLGLRVLMAVAVLDMIEDHHLLAMTRTAAAGDAIDSATIRMQQVLSQTKFSLSYLALALIALGVPRTTMRERAFAWLLGIPLAILGVVQWSAPSLENVLNVARWAGFVGGFVGALAVLRGRAGAGHPTAGATATDVRE